jgi:tRNA modification GTPase
LFTGERDTIFAPASGVGRAAIAIIRVSGPRVAAVLGALAPGIAFPERRAVIVVLRHPQTGGALDRALVLRFAASRSFTGEDMAELQVTGGRAVTAAVFEALAEIHGLRVAEPGEFAWRAFLNGKMDLAEIEGLGDLVDAETEAQRRQALRIAGGALSRECAEIRAHILEAMALVETQIDFSDVEDSSGLDLLGVRKSAEAAARRLDRALATANAGKRLREGFVVVIAGPVNAGKSSLMNVLADREVAIASPIPGTTRDLIEVFLDLRGFPVTLVDTAGIRESADPIEREGVERARKRAAAADLVLWLDDTDRSQPQGIGDAPTIRVRSKIDLAPSALVGKAIAISVKTGEGIDHLLDAIADMAEERMAGPESALLTAERHRAAFAEARAALEPALRLEEPEAELLAEDLRRAARALERVVGRIGVEEVLGEIFSRLCVGK